MRNFEKSTKLNDVCYDIRGPVMDEANRMQANGIQVLKLNIGNPAPFHLYAPDEIIVDMIYNLRDTQGYSDSKGLFSARKAIMQYCQLKKIPNVGIDDVYTGNGASEMITMALQGLLNDGDEVLVPAPDYPLWTAAVTLAGGRAVHYVCDEQSDWYPDIDDMRAKVTDRTKAIVVINPNNPTGALYPREVLEQIVQIARENDLILMADEIYDRLVMDGAEHVALGSLAPDLMVVNINGLSKSHRVTGYRCGWMCLSGDKSRAKGYIEGLNLLASCACARTCPARASSRRRSADSRARTSCSSPAAASTNSANTSTAPSTTSPACPPSSPRRGCTSSPKMDVAKFNIVDDERFALDLLREKKLLITHGRGFHWIAPDHFRIVFLRRSRCSATPRTAFAISSRPIARASDRRANFRALSRAFWERFARRARLIEWSPARPAPANTKGA